MSIIHKAVYRICNNRPRVNRFFDAVGKKINGAGFPYSTGLTRNVATIHASSDPAKIRDSIHEVFNIANRDIRGTQHVFKSLRKDRIFVLAAAKQYGTILFHVGDPLNKDKEIVLAALRTQRSAFQWVDKSLQTDEDIIKAEKESVNI